MKKIFKITFLVLAILFTNLGTDASEKDKICPFELISFDYRLTRYPNEFVEIELEWKTSSEFNTDKFIIEKAYANDSSSNDFFSIGEVKAAGNSNEIKTYSFYDMIGLGTFTYRIKGVDKDSSFSYSSEIIINNYINVIEQRNSNSVSIIENVYPNPAKDKITIELNSLTFQSIDIQLFDIKGVEVMPKISKQLNTSNQLINIDLNNINSGEYVLLVKTDSIVEYRKIAIKR